jgi:hypothetical protein
MAPSCLNVVNIGIILRFVNEVTIVSLSSASSIGSKDFYIAEPLAMSTKQ